MKLIWEINLIFLKEPHINSDVYKDALKKQIEITIDTGNESTDNFIKSIIDSLNKFTVELAKEQIRIVCQQAQKEVDDLHIRVSEGIITAKINGKKIGNEKGVKLTTKKSIKSKEIIKKYSKDFNGILEDADVIKLAGISRNSFYKYKREIREEEM